MRPLIVANWKMNTTLAEALVLASGVKEGVANLTGVDVVLCPPFPWLVPVAEMLQQHRIKHVTVGVQNIFWQEMGAVTGEVAASMLSSLAEYAIIGHSERRRIFHETNAEVVAKTRLAIKAGLRPIVCVGELRKPVAELLADPSELTTRHIRQPAAELEAVVSKLSADEKKALVVAYEPVWAISGGKAGHAAATGWYANAVAGQLRRVAGPAVPILYGGSAKPENAAEFLSQPEINGLLIGGASLDVKNFVAICKAG